MLPQKQGFGKRMAWGTAVFFIALFMMATILPVRGTGNATSLRQFLPLIQQGGVPAPYLLLTPNCSSTADAQFAVRGYGWPPEETVGLFWEGIPQAVVPAGHGSEFYQVWTKSDLDVGTPENPVRYLVEGRANSHSATAVFTLPCTGAPPPSPSLVLLPNCRNTSEATLTVQGFNWPFAESIILFWAGAPRAVIPAWHDGQFAQAWTLSNLPIGTPEDPLVYAVRALSDSHDLTALFYVPCRAPTPTPSGTPTSSPPASATPEATASATPALTPTGTATAVPQTTA